MTNDPVISGIVTFAAFMFVIVTDSLYEVFLLFIYQRIVIVVRGLGRWYGVSVKGGKIVPKMV
jgi:hypothetical protein